ncbi:MAG: glycosyl transferase family 2 [Phycisphaerales bacterium]|nr:glycosyl transferase family 2 [Phycisphaerales bacterium]
MRLLIVIVNYRTASLTIDCLRSLADEVPALTGTRVVVTDNASGDASIGVLTEAIAANGWQQWASLLPLDRNGGFAYGNNAAIRPALESSDPPEYVLLLNPDTVVRLGALRQLLDFMDRHSKVGIAGSRLENPDGTPQRSAFRFHSIGSELESGLRLGLVSRMLSGKVVAPPVPTEAGPTDWVAGASMIIRREVFRDIGLMDEGYFMYFEEVDFCLRASRAGWPCWYVPASRVVHLVGQSSGVTDVKKTRKRRPAYWFESRRRFFVNNFGRLRAFCANVAWATGFATFRARQFVQRKADTDPACLLRDFICYNFLSPFPAAGGGPKTS